MNWKLSTNPELIINLADETFYSIDDTRYQEFLADGGTPLGIDQQPKKPNWKRFRTLFMGDFAYNRMANSVLGTPAQRIETWISAAAAIETEEWALFAGYWNNFIYYVPDAFKATEEEIVVWNQVATASEMPFTFIAGGAMELDAGLSTQFNADNLTSENSEI